MRFQFAIAGLLAILLAMAGCNKTKEVQLDKPVEKTIDLAPGVIPNNKPTPMTARDYFDELRDVNTFNKYYDKYACFPDDGGVGFSVMSTTEDMIVAMNRSGDTKGAQILSKANKSLLVQTFYKGVANGDPIMYDRIDGKYSLDYNAPIRHGRTIYLINWRTGRYRMQIFALDRSNIAPVAETSGRCELIHSDDTPSVVDSVP